MYRDKILDFLKKIAIKTTIGQWIYRIKEYDNRLIEVNNRLLELRMVAVKFHCPELVKEADFLIHNGYAQYPYERIKELDEVETGFDKIEKLPYVVHKGRKLYFPKSENEEWCRRYYITCVRDEAILGGQYLMKHPHQYQSERCKIERGDVLVDVGCAEALMVLDNIDTLSRAYLFECDPRWFDPLKATFKKYKNKVEIICKYVGAEDSDDVITLGTALKDETSNNIFIKMDIEGAEVFVLNGNKKFLTSNKGVKLAVCTYHRQDDASQILSLFKDMGFCYEFSDGYMYLSDFDKNDKFPYFRRGVIRGWKTK